MARLSARTTADRFNCVLAATSRWRPLLGALRTPLIVGFSLALSTSAVTGCSAAADEPADEPAPTEPVTVPASAQTRDGLGVVTWGMRYDAAAQETIVRGYGAHNHRIAELRHKIATAPDEHIDITVSGERGQGHMRMNVGAKMLEDGQSAEVELKVAENTFVDSPDAQRVLDAIGADTGTGTPSVGATTEPSGSLVHSASHPATEGSSGGAQLVQSCSELTRSCDSALVTAVSGAATSNSCGRLVVAGALRLICRWAGALIGGTVGASAGGVAGIPLLGIGAVPGAAAGAAAGAALGAAAGDQACQLATGRSAGRDGMACGRSTVAAVQGARQQEACTSANTSCAASGAGMMLSPQPVL